MKIGTGNSTVKGNMDLIEPEKIGSTGKSTVAKADSKSYVSNSMEVKPQVSKVLADRQVKRREIASPSFYGEQDRKAVTIAFCAHWTKKDPKIIEKNLKNLEKVNSGAMLAMSALLKDGNRVSTCQLPNVVIVSGQYSTFPEEVSSLLDTILKKHPDLRKQVEQSNGLFKKPIAINRQAGAVQSPDEFKKSSSGISYYPRIDTHNKSTTEMSTLFIEDGKSNANKIKGLKKAISQAIHEADKVLPPVSEEAIKAYLR